MSYFITYIPNFVKTKGITMVRKAFIKSLYNQDLTLWENIEDKILYGKFGCFIRHFIRFIKRLPKWIKICWNQEDWDIGYLYDLIEIRLKDFLKAQEEDTWHVPKETKRRAKQIKICLAYLDRYRNWTDYYDYPMDDIYFEKTEDGLGSYMKHKSSINEAKRKGADKYEKFNYNMFWKRFLQWHQHWWT